VAAAKLSLDRAAAVGAVDPRVFGTFVEHLGRCVYTGIYEPDHPAADEHGFRRDVVELARELGTTIVRYPGGNFVSGYDWEDGVGPVARRPARLDLAWHSIESNSVGTDEFIRWARLAGVQPMLAVNLGTRGVEAARALVEYCNHPRGTARAEQRIRNGHREPHAVRTWCLGNEMDGPWQIGHKSASEYGRLAAAAGQAMKLVDPTIELVACGSSARSMPTFGRWEAEVLAECYEVVDYISLHAYYEPVDDDLASFLASACDMDRFIESVVASCDHARACAHSDRRIDLSFDEWNDWYQSRVGELGGRDWEAHPRLIEDVYTLADAVVVGSLLITLLRHADRVRIACLAQLVNAIAPIMTEPGGPAWRQTIFHPFALTAAAVRGGTVLRTEPAGPTLATARYGRVPVVEATAVWHEERDELVILAVNRQPAAALELEIDLRFGRNPRVVEHTMLAGRDPFATNTKEHPRRVAPQTCEGASLERGCLRATLPPLSWNLLRVFPAAPRQAQIT
jgi:alpha-N-arabinofuranosidase